jgi:hypothetical protein
MPGGNQESYFYNNGIANVELYYQNVRSDSFTPVNNNWYLLILNISGTSYTLYQNNVSISTGSLSAALPNGTGVSAGFNIDGSGGNTYGQATYKHAGFALYDRTLTSGELTQIYNSVSTIINTNT